MENEIDFLGDIGWDIYPETFISKLKSFNGADVVINIGSGGGYIVDGISIMNAINSYSGKVTARISVAASMATQVALACDEIEVYENAVFMIHESSGGAYGRAKDMISKANLLNSYNKMFAKNYVVKTGKTEDEINSMMDLETYMFGSEILDNGFADRVIPMKPDSETDANILKDITMTMVKSCNNKMNEKPESIEKLSACIATMVKNTPIHIENNVNLKKDDIIVPETKNKKGDSEMEKEIQDALQADRERCSAIMALGCPAEMAANAIKDGKSAGDVALEMVMASKKEKEINLTNFENSGKEVNLDLDEPTKEVNKSAEQLALEADDEAFFNERRGK